MSRAYTCTIRSRSACLQPYLPIYVGIALYGYEIYRTIGLILDVFWAFFFSFFFFAECIVSLNTPYEMMSFWCVLYIYIYGYTVSNRLHVLLKSLILHPMWLAIFSNLLRKQLDNY